MYIVCVYNPQVGLDKETLASLEGLAREILSTDKVFFTEMGISVHGGHDSSNRNNMGKLIGFYNST